MSNTSLPVLDFSEVSRSQLFKRQSLAPTEKGTIVQGVVDSVVVAETKDGSKNPGTLQFIFNIKPLDANGKPVGYGVRHFMPIPKDNPNRPGHKLTDAQKEDGYKKCRETINAFLGADTIPPTVSKDEATGKWVDKDGNPVAGKAFEALKQAQAAAVDEVLGQWYRVDEATGKHGFEDLKGALVYMTLRKSGAFMNIGYLRHDAGNAQLVGAEMVRED